VVGKTSLARGARERSSTRGWCSKVGRGQSVSRAVLRRPRTSNAPTGSNSTFLLTRYNQQTRTRAGRICSRRATVADYLFSKGPPFFSAALNLAPDELALYDQCLLGLARCAKCHARTWWVYIRAKRRGADRAAPCAKRNRDFRGAISACNIWSGVSSAFRDFFFYYE